MSESKLQTIVVNSVEVNPLVVNGVMVLTLSMMDKVHGRPNGTARKRFNDNKDRLNEGEDYFVRNSDEAKQLGITAPNGITLVTESGYLLLVKSFTDDLAWQVQKQLVKTYFAAGRPSQINSDLEYLLPSECQTMKELVELRCAAYPPESQKKVHGEIWSRVHRKFRVNSYERLARTQLAEAIVYVTGMEVRSVSLSGEKISNEQYAALSREISRMSRYVWFESSFCHNAWKVSRMAAGADRAENILAHNFPKAEAELRRVSQRVEAFFEVKSEFERRAMKWLFGESSELLAEPKLPSMPNRLAS